MITLWSMAMLQNSVENATLFVMKQLCGVDYHLICTLIGFVLISVDFWADFKLLLCLVLCTIS